MSVVRMREPAHGCTEAQWQATVIMAAELLGWTGYHTYDSRRSAHGFPDLVLVHPVHGVVWMELKSEKGRTTADQDRWIALLQEAGERAGVFRPSEWDFVEQVLKGEVWRLVDCHDGTIEQVLA